MSTTIKSSNSPTISSSRVVKLVWQELTLEIVPRSWPDNRAWQATSKCETHRTWILIWGEWRHRMAPPTHSHRWQTRTQQPTSTAIQQLISTVIQRLISQIARTNHRCRRAPVVLKIRLSSGKKRRITIGCIMQRQQPSKWRKMSKWHMRQRKNHRQASLQWKRRRSCSHRTQLTNLNWPCISSQKRRNGSLMSLMGVMSRCRTKFRLERRHGAWSSTSPTIITKLILICLLLSLRTTLLSRANGSHLTLITFKTLY